MHVGPASSSRHCIPFHPLFLMCHYRKKLHTIKASTQQPSTGPAIQAHQPKRDPHHIRTSPSTINPSHKCTTTCRRPVKWMLYASRHACGCAGEHFCEQTGCWLRRIRTRSQRSQDRRAQIFFSYFKLFLATHRSPACVRSHTIRLLFFSAFTMWHQCI